MPRAGLNREVVTVAALGLVDAAGVNGLADLSLSALAASVGVAVPSLYKHVDSLADLRRCVAVASVRELTARLSAAAEGREGRDALRSMATGIREYAHEKPGRYLALQHAADASDPADAELARVSADLLVVLAAVLHAFELPAVREIDGIRMLRSALHGFIMLELTGGFGLPDDLDRSFSVLVETVVAGVERLAAPSPGE